MKKVLLTMAFAVMANLTVNATDYLLTEVNNVSNICTSGDGRCPQEVLPGVLNKALQNIAEGSIIAIDQVRVSMSTYALDYFGNRCGSFTKDVFEEIVVEYLLDNGFRVVAKNYLEKLYTEQQAQQSGIYNERTTVQENNFSAVGFYLNVKIADDVVVRVINVSTGEYVGNAREHY